MKTVPAVAILDKEPQFVSFAHLRKQKLKSLTLWFTYWKHIYKIETFARNTEKNIFVSFNDPCGSVYVYSIQSLLWPMEPTKISSKI